MSNIGILCPPVPSHIHLNSILGRALQKRGHRVTCFQLPELQSKIEDQGLRFLPLATMGAPTGELTAALKQIGDKTGLAALRITLHCASRFVHLVCESAPAALRNAGIEMVLVDQNEPGGATVAEHLGLPFISVCSGLPLNREPRVPPPFVPWTFRDTWWGELRNRAAYAVFDRIVAPVNRALQIYRRKWGLSPIHLPDDTFSRVAQLCPLPPTFDFPRAERPSGFRYLGPFRDDFRHAVPFPWERLNGKPLIYASLGTLQNRIADSFRFIAAAVAGLDVQLVISLGGGLDLGTESLLGSPVVVNYAPQMEVLSRARLCITHAGLNTVLESLTLGVPMVAIPITNDQPANAARVKWSGAGELVPLGQLGKDRFREVVLKVLKEPEYRRHAQRLQHEIQQCGGVEGAADVVEQAMRAK